METSKKIKKFIKYWYIRYLLATELYMVEPWEKVVIHIIFVLLFTIFWYLNYHVVLTAIGHLRSGATPFTKELV